DREDGGPAGVRRAAGRSGEGLGDRGAGEGDCVDTVVERLDDEMVLRRLGPVGVHALDLVAPTREDRLEVGSRRLGPHDADAARWAGQFAGEGNGRIRAGDEVNGNARRGE